MSGKPVIQLLSSSYKRNLRRLTIFHSLVCLGAHLIDALSTASRSKCDRTLPAGQFFDLELSQLTLMSPIPPLEKIWQLQTPVKTEKQGLQGKQIP